jgi:cathepsin X
LGLALPFSLSWPRLRANLYRARCLPWRRRYCGSCWAHGSVSALGDRIKIARKGKGIDINLSVQHLLNCGNVGSCHGGSVDGPYQWLHRLSQTGTGISYETQQPYMACSQESQEGLCGAGDWTCTPENIARTCSTFPPRGKCVGITKYPNATISEYGSVSGADNMAKEIYSRGPIACGIDAAPILNYQGGIVSMPGNQIDHVISVVGWGNDATAGQYWIVRNSWGEYWGEMGYIRVAKGNNALHLEEQCAWAVPEHWTENNFPCNEDGSVRSAARPLLWPPLRLPTHGLDNVCHPCLCCLPRRTVAPPSKQCSAADVSLQRCLDVQPDGWHRTHQGGTRVARCVRRGGSSGPERERASTEWRGPKDVCSAQAKSSCRDRPQRRKASRDGVG